MKMVDTLVSLAIADAICNPNKNKHFSLQESCIMIKSKYMKSKNHRCSYRFNSIKDVIDFILNNPWIL